MVATFSYRRLNPGLRFELALKRSASGWNERAWKFKSEPIAAETPLGLMVLVPIHSTVVTRKGMKAAGNLRKLDRFTL
jgi:hypothetical protein